MLCTTNRLYLKNFLVFLLPFLLLSLAACGGSGSSGGSSDVGKTAAIEMSSGAETLPARSGSTWIEVQLTDSTGNPVDQDTRVVFRTNIGTFSSNRDQKETSRETADESGVIRVTLHAPYDEGVAEVEAESNGVSQKVEIRFVDPDKIMSLTLSTGSDSIIADGSSQVAVIATLTGPDGNPVEGLSITFKTTLGKFQDNDLSSDGEGGTSLSEKVTTAITDVDGEARVMLTSSRSAGEATITAEVSGIVQTTSIFFYAGDPVSMNLRAVPDTIRPMGATEIVARVFDINNNPVPDQEVIFTELINGSGGELDELSAITNVNGDARVTYFAGGDPGADIIQASLASDRGMKATTTVLVDPAAIVVGNISLTIGSPSLVADGTSQVNVRAVVTDVDGNPASGKRVSFSSTAGTLTAASEYTSDTGLAEVRLRAGTKAGPVIVRAECNGFIAEANVEFVPGQAAKILLYAFPNLVPPNGAFQTAAIVMDENDNRISSERLLIKVRRVNSPDIIDSAELTPDQAEDGVYRFDWTAASDYYGTGDLEITAEVNNGVSESVIVRIREGAIIVGSITLTAGSTSLEADGNSTTSIRATVLDNNGQPAGGIPVNFSTTLGSLSSFVQTTNQEGIAEVRLRAGTVEGIARVIADANGWREQVNIEFVSGFPGNLGLTALPSTVSPGATSTITATLTDRTGAPISGEALHFDISQNNSGGGLSATTATTNAVGKAVVTYTAGTFSGTDRIQVVSASNSSVQRTTTVQVETGGGFVGIINLAADSNSLPADGRSSTAIRAEILDSAGNPVPEGTAVTFNTDLGQFSTNGAMSVTRQTIDDSGMVVVTLISSTQPGVATITAKSGSVSSSVNVTFESESGGPVPGNIEILIVTSILPADGTSTTEVIATVRTDENQAVEGATVNFSIDCGEEIVSCGTITSPHLTDANGRAIATLTSARWEVPEVTVTAECQGKDAEATMAFIGISLELEADQETLPVGEETRVEGILKDSNGNPIGNEEVTIEISGGGSYDILKIYTDYNGRFEFTVTSETPGITTVTASARGVETELDINFTQFRVELEVIEKVGKDETTITTIRTDGENDVELKAKVYGVPQDEEEEVSDKCEFSFSSTLGEIDDDGSKPYRADDGAIIKKMDFNPGAQSGRATIEVIVKVKEEEEVIATLSARTYLTIIGGDAVKIVLSPDPRVIRVNSGESTIQVRAFDENDQPAGGQQIYFRIAKGPGGGEYLGNSVRTTDSNGQTSVNFFAGALISSEVIIEADTTSNFSNDAIASATIIISGPVARIAVSTNLEKLEESDFIEGHLDLGVSAIVTDIYGNPVADGTNVYFGVTSIEFDEDRDGDGVIKCWHYEQGIKDDCDCDDPDDPDDDPPPCSINEDCCDGTSGIDWFTNDVNLNGKLDFATTEDVNNNGILDLGEDINDNGVIDPIQGSSIVSPVPTVNGIAVTTLSYPMSHAANIKVRITAEAAGVSNFYDQTLLCTETMVENGTCGLGY